jgi:hypothetical protein
MSKQPDRANLVAQQLLNGTALWLYSDSQIFSEVEHMIRQELEVTRLKEREQCCKDICPGCRYMEHCRFVR